MYLPLRFQIQSQHGLIAHRQLAEAGLTGNEVRRLVVAGSLVRVRRGVYVDAETWAALEPYREQPMIRIRAAQLALQSEHVLSHDSASIVLGMGAPGPRDALVHVTRSKVHGDAVRAGVKHHLAPYRPDDVLTREGLTLLGPARTALDMVREHGRAHGLAACDTAMRKGTTRTQLSGVLQGMGSWPHSRSMRWCVEHADGRAESYLESLGRDLVLELGIGRPELQFGITDGHRTAFVDMVVGRHCIEVDGRMKYEPDNLSGHDPVVVLAGGHTHEPMIRRFGARPAALRRLAREYADTCSRFGTDVADLASYRISRSPARRTG